jgi:integrase
MATGIRKRGSSWEASVFDARSGKKLRRTFPTMAAAKSWRADALVAVRKGALKQSPRVTLQEASTSLLQGMRDGSIRTKGGSVYRPTTVAQTERSLRRHVLPALGNTRVDRLDARTLREFADNMLAKGLDPGTVLSAMQPLRLILRRAVLDGQLASNPSRELGLPSGKRREDVVTDPAHAQRLLDALEPSERVIYATAFFAGLRRGELRALRWRHVDLASGTIRVEESVSCGEKTPGPVKTDAGRRTIPIIAALRDHLLEHRMSMRSSADAFVFGADGRPFASTTVRRRAARAWKRAGLEPTQLHAARHTFASILIAAGVNAKALTVYMGHASLGTTHDLYGHLMRGSEDEAVALVDAYLARSASTDAPRMRQSDPGTTASNRT